MKINGPGQPPVPGQGAPAAPETPAGSKPGEAASVGSSGGVAPADKTVKTGRSFADTVAGTAPVRPSGTTSVDRAGGISVQDVAAELRAGKLDARGAVDKVIDRVLGAHLGAEAPAPLRAQVQAALRDALDDDPLLAEKLKNLA